MTLLAEVVRTSAAVAATPSRLEKTRLIAECLRALQPDEVEIAIAYLSGDARQGKMSVGYRTLQSAADAPAAASTLTLLDVDTRLDGLNNT
ncbi:MAG TPA: hypothetical protein VM756_07130, partial [Burkholderiales bacterium]|nr:hypothetical protein [Burkholderiales bacterium]